MPLDLSTKSFPITCPKCGYKSQKTLAWLQNNLEFNCSGFGNLIRADRANIPSPIWRKRSRESTTACGALAMPLRDADNSEMASTIAASARGCTLKCRALPTMCASLPIKPAALALAAGLVCMPLGIHAKADVQRYAIVMEALGRPKDDALAQKLDSLEVFLAKNGTPQPEARQVITTHLRASFLNPSLIPELVALVRDISAVTGTDIVLEN